MSIATYGKLLKMRFCSVSLVRKAPRLYVATNSIPVVSAISGRKSLSDSYKRNFSEKNISMKNTCSTSISCMIYC